MISDLIAQTFLTLAETLSYTKTARKLYITSQTVSRNIATLEKEFGVQLIISTTRSVMLTPAGRQCYEMLREFAKLYEEKRAQIRQQGMHMKLGIQSFMDPAPLISFMERLEAERPDITLEIVSLPPSILVDQYNRRLIDMVLLLDRFLSPEIKGAKRELFSQPLYLMVSDRNPAATDDAVYTDFMSLPFIFDVLEGEDRLTHNTRMQHDIDMWGINPEEIIWTYDRGSAIAYAEFGYGIIIDSDLSKLMGNRRLKLYDTGMRESWWFIHQTDTIDEKLGKDLRERLRSAIQKSAQNPINK